MRQVKMPRTSKILYENLWQHTIIIYLFLQKIVDSVWALWKKN